MTSGRVCPLSRISLPALFAQTFPEGTAAGQQSGEDGGESGKSPGYDATWEVVRKPESHPKGENIYFFKIKKCLPAPVATPRRSQGFSINGRFAY